MDAATNDVLLRAIKGLGQPGTFTSVYAEGIGWFLVTAIDTHGKLARLTLRGDGGVVSVAIERIIAVKHGHIGPEL